MDVRRLREGEGGQLRELRLRALADFPDAFASSLHHERHEPAEYWEGLASRSEAADREVTFVAERGDAEWVGMAGAHLIRDEHYKAALAAIWVAPDARGFGLGRRLVEDVAEWAAARGATRLQVSVTETNVGALAFCRRRGFEATGERTPLVSNPELHELTMLRALGPVP